MLKQDVTRLVEKAIQSDGNAFEELCLIKGKGILYMCSQMMGNWHDAEDATQEVFIRMYRGIGSLQNPEGFSTWLQRIVYRTCIDLRRRQMKKNKDIAIDDFTDILPELSAEFIPQTYIEDMDKREVLRDIINALPRDYKITVIMFYFENLSQADIAQITQTNVQVVKNNLLRARQKIKQEIKKQEGADAKGKKLPMSAISSLLQQEVENIPQAAVLECLRQAMDGGVAATAAASAAKLGKILPALGIAAAASMAVAAMLTRSLWLPANAVQEPDAPQLPAVHSVASVVEPEDITSPQDVPQILSMPAQSPEVSVSATDNIKDDSNPDPNVKEEIWANSFRMTVAEVASFDNAKYIARASAAAFVKGTNTPVAIDTVVPTGVLAIPGDYDVTFKTKAGTSVTVTATVYDKGGPNPDPNVKEEIWANNFRMTVAEVASFDNAKYIARASAAAFVKGTNTPVAIDTVDAKAVQATPGDYDVTFKTKAGTSVTVTATVYDKGGPNPDPNVKEEIWANNFRMTVAEVASFDKAKYIARASAAAFVKGTNTPVAIDTVVSTGVLAVPGDYDVTFKTKAGTSVTVTATVYDKGGPNPDPNVKEEIWANNFRMSVKEVGSFDKAKYIARAGAKAFVTGTHNAVAIDTVQSSKVLITPGNYDVTFKTKAGTSVTVTATVYDEGGPNPDPNVKEEIWANNFRMTVAEVASFDNAKYIARARAKAFVTGTHNAIEISTVEAGKVLATPGKYEVAFKTKAGTSATVNVTVYDRRNEDITKGEEICGNNFSISIVDVENLKPADYIALAAAKAWDTADNKNAEIAIHSVDTSNVDIDNPGTYPVSFKTANGTTVTINVKVEDEKFVVTFNLAGGGNSFTQSVSYKKMVSKPVDDPKFLGHNFLQWIGEDGRPWDFAANKMPAKNITLTAQWELTTYQVTYVSADHVIGTENVKYSQLVPRKTPPPYPGHGVYYWSLENNPHTAFDFDTYTMPAHNITLVARWTKSDVSSSTPVPISSRPSSSSSSSSDTSSEAYSEPISDEPPVSSVSQSAIVVQSGGSSSPESLAVSSTASGVLSLWGISDGGIPLGGLSQEGHWSLLSLLFALFSLAMVVATVISLLTKRGRRGEDEYDARSRFKGRMIKLISAILGLLPCVAFMVCDSLGSPVAFINRYTVIVGLLFLLHMAAVVLGAMRSRNLQEDDAEYSDEAGA